MMELFGLVPPAVSHQEQPAGSVGLYHETGHLQATRIVLATAYLDHDPFNNAAANLATVYQRCHLLNDAPENRRRAVTVRARRACGDLFTGP